MKSRTQFLTKQRFLSHQASGKLPKEMNYLQFMVMRAIELLTLSGKKKTFATNLRIAEAARLRGSLETRRLLVDLALYGSTFKDDEQPRPQAQSAEMVLVNVGVRSCEDPDSYWKALVKIPLCSYMEFKSYLESRREYFEEEDSSGECVDLQLDKDILRCLPTDSIPDGFNAGKLIGIVETFELAGTDS